MFSAYNGATPSKNCLNNVDPPSSSRYTRFLCAKPLFVNAYFKSILPTKKIKNFANLTFSSSGLRRPCDLGGSLREVGGRGPCSGTRALSAALSLQYAYIYIIL
jgi:hypothetical protein